jgi:GNAT superfamily N-acetyltransferase
MTRFSIKEAAVTNELLTKIDEGFRQHGMDQTGHNIPIIRTAFTANEKDFFAGAVTVHVLWGTLHIRHMFIEAPYRRQGLGSTLMFKAFDYGKSQGCTIAFVDTMSYQALGFYQKLGFVLEFTRTGFAHDSSLHYLKKSLV